jgi:hypothetical protein
VRSLGSWALVLFSEDGDTWRGDEFCFISEVWLLLNCGSGFYPLGFLCTMVRVLRESIDVPALILMPGRFD